MERIGAIFRNPQEAEEAERQAMWALTPAERMAIAKTLRDRVYGPNPPDVRESERTRR